MGETVPILEGEFREPEVPEARSARKPGRREALLDNIRSAANVGSIFRTAEGFGFEHIYLGGITPCPDDLDVKKTSLGSEEFVAWTYHRNSMELLRMLKKKGHEIWVLENMPGAAPIDQVDLTTVHSAPVVLVVGSEITGVDPGIVEAADSVLCLPMFGRKTSLNVAVAFAIAAYALTPS